MKLIDEVGIACDTLDQVWALDTNEQAFIDTVTEINGADTLPDVMTNIFGITIEDIDFVCDEVHCETLTVALTKYREAHEKRVGKIMSQLQMVIDNIDTRESWDTHDADNWDSICAHITDAMVFINHSERLNSPLIKEK